MEEVKKDKPGDAPHNETEIVVNGRGRRVQGHSITFETIVELAFPGTPSDPSVVFSMTYQGASSKPTSGELGPGGVVQIKNGTRFNVTKTTKS